jgi:hypothetical protein
MRLTWLICSVMTVLALAPDAAAQRGRNTQRAFDRNNDGVITRDEWRGNDRSFGLLDWNNDGRLSGDELREAFRDDVARQGQARDARVVERTDQSFTRMDTNHDGFVSRTEFLGTANSAAYRAGYERGQRDGQAAGREDRMRNQGYDLNGQRELETADAGYNASLGARAEYQEGYRAGFIAAYPQGFDGVR